MQPILKYRTPAQTQVASARTNLNCLGMWNGAEITRMESTTTGPQPQACEKLVGYAHQRIIGLSTME